MAVRYVDDGGDNTTGLSWATAYTSINALIAAESSFVSTSGNIVYFGHDSVCQATNTATLTINGPSTPEPVYFISVTQGSSPVAYQKSTADQIDCSEGDYQFRPQQNIVLLGLQIKTGNSFFPISDTNDRHFVYDCRFRPGDGTTGLSLSSWNGEIINCQLDFTQDTINTFSPCVYVGPAVTVRNLTIENASFRTDEFMTLIDSKAFFTGCDLSSLSNVQHLCKIVKGEVMFLNCKLPSSYAVQTIGSMNTRVTLVNSGASDDPTALVVDGAYGTCISDTTITRTGGASVESTAVSWEVTTTADCTEYAPMRTPWIYGTTTSGSKTFDVYVVNDTADLNNDEIWLEVEYMGTINEPQLTAADDKSTWLATPFAQTDDTSSTWSGTGPSFTYKQKLSVTATIGEEGQYRARVCVGKTSIAASSNLYIDPLVTVT